MDKPCHVPAAFYHAYLFMLPGVLFFAVFMIYPFGEAFRISLFN